MRAKCAVFPISVRNSAPAVAHLLTKTNVTHLLVGPEGQYQQLAADALKILKEAGNAVPDASIMLAFEDIMSGDDQPFVPLPALKVTWDDPALVQHSSGQCSAYVCCAQLEMTVLPRNDGVSKTNHMVTLAISSMGNRSMYAVPPVCIRSDHDSPCIRRLWGKGYMRNASWYPSLTYVPWNGNDTNRLGGVCSSAKQVCHVLIISYAGDCRSYSCDVQAPNSSNCTDTRESHSSIRRHQVRKWFLRPSVRRGTTSLAVRII